ncbi:MAG: hypothetical protein NWE89_04220 [Candidatus Bathyarchaeota archaeon]|nr:hypothetical protein [Candidatus Bathyarchaeota archaeon]
MSEKKIIELSDMLVSKQIRQANLKREKKVYAEITSLDSEIIALKREINQELQQLSREKIVDLDVETDDTQRNR